MTARALASFLLAATLAACGGKSTGPAKPEGPLPEGDDAATPFNDATVKADVSRAPGVEACGAAPTTTMGAHFAAQRNTLTGGDASVPVSETFTCRARSDNAWDCEWAVFAMGGQYAIRFTVSTSGDVTRATIACDAPL